MITTICTHCGLAGHTKGKCPERPALRIPAFLDSDPIPFATVPAAEMVKSYDPDCVRCRYSRPGTSTTHADHVAEANTRSVVAQR
jgi:hypothetical protein